MRRSVRALFAVFAVVVTMGWLIADADARVGGKGGSMGSRGTRTFSAPPPTSTAPTAAPIQRSITQPSQQPGGAAAAARPAAQSGSWFNRPGMGLLGGLAAGFLGAGLFGMLFGGGFMAGLGGFASILGLLIQVALVVIVARLAWSWWQRRNQPATAAGPSLRHIEPEASHQRPMASGFGGGLGGALGGLGLGGNRASAAAANEPSDQIGIEGADYDAFEKILVDTQAAYSNEDIGALKALATPEMVSYFAEELTENASRGVVNKISGVKLEQGDLAEAWREDGADYATVAMRFSLTDQMIDRASNKVVEGGEADEATELWTFRRARGGHWILSAIQQPN